MSEDKVSLLVIDLKASSLGGTHPDILTGMAWRKAVSVATKRDQTIPAYMAKELLRADKPP